MKPSYYEFLQYYLVIFSFLTTAVDVVVYVVLLLMDEELKLLLFISQNCHSLSNILVDKCCSLNNNNDSS